MKQAKYLYMKTIKICSIAVLLFSFSCSEKNDPIVIETLESSKLLFSRGKGEISNLIDFAESQISGIIELKPYLNYDITVYEITYKTDYLGQEIIASGLVTFPNTDRQVPMMSFQHGTMIKHSDAPTVDQSNYYTFLSSVASAGYIFLIPDYIGFGSSSNVLHPYYHEDLTASTIVDMLKAAKELAIQEGYHFDGNVFLSGYSEGGYATMATHKSLEENPVTGLNLIASAPSSGGYDIKGMQEYFFGLTTYHQPFYIAFVAMAYQSIYGWDGFSTLFFQEPYATQIPTLFDGTINGGAINAQLTDVVADLLQPDALVNIDTDNRYSEVVAAFEENSLDQWIPTKTMYMYHGTDDNTVPYQNSVEVYNNMIALGADPTIVTFTPLEGYTHGTGFFPYFFDLLYKFDLLK